MTVRVPRRLFVVSKILEYRRKELEKHVPRDPSVYYITDLVRCSMKREFEIQHPELLYTRITNGRTFLGDLVHIGLETILKSVFGERLVTEKDSDLERERVVIVDGSRYVVKGTVDAILDGSVGIEIKETLSSSTLPFQHHVDQCRLYNWLYGFSKTILVYMTPEGMYEYEVVDRATDEEVKSRIREFKAPRYEWECRYCEFKEVCPTYRALMSQKMLTK